MTCLGPVFVIYAKQTYSEWVCEWVSECHRINNDYMRLH